MDDQTQPIETPAAPIETPAAPIETPVASIEMPAAPIDTPQAPARSSRTRWVIGIGVAVLALVVAIGAVLALSKPATPVALQYIPGNAAIVGELRMDLPGDQLQHVGNLLAHFPGFADQSTLNAKLDEAVQRLIATDPSANVSYVTDIKPWLNGPAFIALMAPSITAPATGTGSNGIERFQGVISATTNGAADCAAVFKNQTPTHETYRNLDLSISADGAEACVLDGRQALLGDPATVRLALDAKAGGTGMDKSVTYAAARAALGLDRLATMYVSGDAVSKLLPAASAAPSAPDISALVGPLPAWTMAGIRAEDDALVLDSVTAPIPPSSTGPSLLPVPAGHPSVLAPIVPKDAVVFVEAQGAGVAIQNLLTKLRTIPTLASSLQVLDGLGGSGKLVGWIDDAGFVVSVHDATPEAAALLVAKDEASATSTVASLGTLLTLAGQGGKIQVAQSTINGVTVTTVTIPDAGALVPAGSLNGVTVPSTGPISFSMAAHGKVVIVASGIDAMTWILNVAPGSSLADDAAFKLAGSRGLANSRATVYVAGGPAVAQIEQLAGSDARIAEMANIKPYLDPIQSVSITTAEDFDREPFADRDQRHQALVPVKAGTKEEHMAVRIRLTRVGAKKQPSYRVVVADSRSARDSRSIETLGHYNPLAEPVEFVVDAEKAKAWIAKGAQPSDTVARLFRAAGVLPAEKK